jgi:superfamily II DNA or RNA helicase
MERVEFPLFPDQNRVKSEVIAAINDGARNVFIQMSTGSGKTRLACSLARGMVEKDGRVLFTVHRDELSRQTQKAFYNFERLSSGVIASGKTLQLYEPVQVGMIQTLANRLVKKSFDGVHFDYCFIDEAQHFASRTWSGVHQNLLERNDRMVSIALSGTPWRYDGTGFDDTFEVLICGPQPSELIAAGRLAPVVPFSVPLDVFESVAVTKTGNEFSEKEQETKIISSHIFGDVLSTYRNYVDGAPSIFFCPTVAVAELFADEFTRAGYPSFCVHAKTPDDLRKAYFDGLDTGETACIFNVDIATEGFDCPNVACVGLLLKTMSLTRYLQMVGRAMRTAPGKTCGILIDFAGNYHIHGDPAQNRTWSLRGMENRRKEKSIIVMSRCLDCGYCTSGRPVKCPYCGADMHMETTERRISYVPSELIQMQSSIDLSQIKNQVLFYKDLKKIEKEIITLKPDNRDILKVVEELCAKNGKGTDFLNIVYADIMRKKQL